MSYSTAQQQIITRIIDIGRQRGLATDFIRAALSAGKVESNFKNLNYGDRDSLGVFQQRPSVGEWGTAAQILNVDHAINKFYDAAQRYYQPGMAPGELAARVQRPAAQYRSRYAQVMSQTDTLLSGAGATPVGSMPIATMPIATNLPGAGSSNTDNYGKAVASDAAVSYTSAGVVGSLLLIAVGLKLVFG